MVPKVEPHRSSDLFLIFGVLSRTPSSSTLAIRLHSKPPRLGVPRKPAARMVHERTEAYAGVEVSKECLEVCVRRGREAREGEHTFGVSNDPAGTQTLLEPAS